MSAGAWPWGSGGAQQCVGRVRLANVGVHGVP